MRFNQWSSASTRLVAAAALIGLFASQLCEDSRAEAADNAKPAQILAYPLAPGLSASSEVSAEAEGVPIEVESLRPTFPPDAPSWFHVPETENLAVDIARFSCDGPCTLTILLKQPINTVVVRPKSRRIPVSVIGPGRKLTLALPGPCKLIVEMGGLPPLLVFADPPEQNVPRPDEVTYYFGPGEHSPGLITLKDNEKVYIAAGAVVYGGISGGPHGAKVSGRGILDGSRLRSPLVALTHAAQVEFDGILLRRGHGWQNTLRDCDDVLYRNVKILSFTPYGDGLDPVSSRNVRIEDCFFRCSDDCIAVKAMKHGPKVSGIAVRDCVMAGYSFSDGFTVGFEADTDSIDDISVRNCDILCATGGNKAGRHSAFSVICDGPADVHNVTFEDIRVEEKVARLFELNVTDGRKYTKGPPGRIHNVLVKNVRWETVHPIILHGQDVEHLVEDVTFEGCTVAGQPLTLSDVQGNEFVRNVVIRGR
jgi:hypothetical protein